MATKTTSYVRFDVSELPVGHEPERTVKAYGFAEPEPRVLKPLSFTGQVGEIVDYGSPFGDLFKEGSLTLGESAALFNAYLSAKRGLWEPTKGQREYLDHLFDRIGYGHVCQTVVDFNNGDKSNLVKEGCKRVLLIDSPELLVVENGVIKEAKGGERKPKLWPQNGYVGRTCDGSYDPDGVPLETWETRKQAEQTWLDVGADQEFATDAVSHTWAREEDQGIAVVYRGFFGSGDGRFVLDADGGPGSRGGSVGRVPANSSKLSGQFYYHLCHTKPCSRKHMIWSDGYIQLSANFQEARELFYQKE
ncbi:MAG: hypothetical protein HZB67_05665 [Candidatus Aenigmarchaeota archaeon]|nr:hypothetical protein [Candidatus Aenigmarchaeota archaeon]